MIWASDVAVDRLTTRAVKAPEPLIVPAKTLFRVSLATGIDSPVSHDSSTSDVPPGLRRRGESSRPVARSSCLQSRLCSTGRRDLLIAALENGYGRRQVEQLADRRGGSPFGTCLQDFAQRDEGQDQRPSMKVMLMRLSHKSPTPARIRGGGAERDQRVHAGRSVPQLPPGSDDVRATDIDLQYGRECELQPGGDSGQRWCSWLAATGLRRADRRRQSIVAANRLFRLLVGPSRRLRLRRRFDREAEYPDAGHGRNEVGDGQFRAAVTEACSVARLTRASLDSRDLSQGLFDARHATGAVHPANVEGPAVCGRGGTSEWVLLGKYIPVAIDDWHGRRESKDQTDTKTGPQMIAEITFHRRRTHVRAAAGYQ